MHHIGELWPIEGHCWVSACAWGRVLFLTTPFSIPRRIDDSNHSLAAGMYVDVPDFDDLPTAPSITLEGLDHSTRKPHDVPIGGSVGNSR